MYKQKNKIRLEKSKRPIHWVKRKIMLIITAFMIGISNGVYEENDTFYKNQNHTEQKQKLD